MSRSHKRVAHGKPSACLLTLSGACACAEPLDLCLPSLNILTSWAMSASLSSSLKTGRVFGGFACLADGSLPELPSSFAHRIERNQCHRGVSAREECALCAVPHRCVCPGLALALQRESQRQQRHTYATHIHTQAPPAHQPGHRHACAVFCATAVGPAQTRQSSRCQTIAVACGRTHGHGHQKRAMRQEGDTTVVYSALAAH